jgi:hypothetical protein
VQAGVAVLQGGGGVADQVRSAGEEWAERWQTSTHNGHANVHSRPESCFHERGALAAGNIAVDDTKDAGNDDAGKDVRNGD